MPKLKTKSSAKKRFRFTASGKIKMPQAGKRHGMIKRTNSQIRKQRGTTIMTKQDSKIVKSYMPHDYNFKIKNAKKFISKGNKVKFTVKFKGRDMQHTDLGKDLMNKIIEETKDIAKVESKPKFEGRQMVMIIQPL